MVSERRKMPLVKNLLMGAFAGSIVGSFAFGAIVSFGSTTPLYDLANFVFAVILACGIVLAATLLLWLPTAFAAFLLIKLFGNSPLVWQGVAISTTCLAGIGSGFFWFASTASAVALLIAGLGAGLLGWRISDGARGDRAEVFPFSDR